MDTFLPASYSLMNIATSRIFEDTGWILTDPLSPKPSLLRSIYKKKHLEVKEDNWGFYRFADWLPVNRILKNSATSVTKRSEKLAKELGLKNLYITFSGYWPEEGAFMRTCSFKETEAYSVCGRLDVNDEKVLVVASAGNTARAFAQVCSENEIPLLLCVPVANIDTLWFTKPLNDCIKLICTDKGSDYFDAIALSQIICKSDIFREEGGAKNVARRDGMGTTVLSAAVTIGEIPDVYFQAIGSGTGAIAAWEANIRLVEDGHYGNKKMRLHTLQNLPFAPIYDAWRRKSRSLLTYDEDEARKRAFSIDAKVLSNRRPPYSVAGGLYDALKESGGDVDAVNNRTLRRYAAMFEELEGIDIYSASAVAVAGLDRAVKSGKVKPEEIVMLNITGGGEKKCLKHHKAWYMKPALIVNTSYSPERIISAAETLFR